MSVAKAGECAGADLGGGAIRGWLGKIGRIWNVDAVEVNRPVPAQGDPLACKSSVPAATIQK
ncbi:hypothetical protein [Pseudarthrobacter sp. YALA5]|uniref:hypothetical protein n=1 Tax=Pseudarthrobacter sp. DSP2-3-2b1 TaxID=2804661 RepID=UPI00103FF1F3